MRKKALHGVRDCAAVFLPVSVIATDETRFQNRKTAFSEASADAVARDYDPNKFDPIVVWEDKRSKKIFVLSGHSRFEGIKRRGEKMIAVRFFEGTEAQAIQFAKVDANRTATAESFVEDIAAYKLMRDGDPARGLKPASKTELKKSFKGKWNRLEIATYLDPYGKFIQALSSENKSEFPFIERIAGWAGEIMRDNPDLTPIHERDIFNFVYSDEKNYKLQKEEFEKLVNDRILLGKERLFPECTDNGCEKIKAVTDILKSRREKEIYRSIDEIDKDLKQISERLKTEKIGLKVYTEAEKDKLREIAAVLEAEKKQLQKELGIAEKAANAPGLFGLGAPPKLPSSYKIKSVMTDKEVIKELEKNGWEFIKKSGGSHRKFKKNGYHCIVPFHNGETLKTKTLNSIIKQIYDGENA